ncbi:glutathione S-transferase N-terminal domain-containing protein [Candidatus Micrarchaeota archaeon]|nr:glutathione S-transferase N-terminal domain-containing protein [Candidatus Micrarchaeota archaeon]
MAKVIVYTAEWCPWCHKVMDFLKENKVEFEPRDVSNKEFAKESMEKSGQGGIPVTDIDGQIVVGFDVKKIKELLGLE